VLKERRRQIRNAVEKFGNGRVNEQLNSLGFKKQGVISMDIDNGWCFDMARMGGLEHAPLLAS
jgi:hypothetical protein